MLCWCLGAVGCWGADCALFSSAPKHLKKRHSSCRFIVVVFCFVFVFCFVVVVVVVDDDNRVQCIEVSARLAAKVRHAGVDRDNGKSNPNLFYFLFYNRD